MLFKTLCGYFEKIESTSKRLEITAILANIINECSNEDIYQAVFLSLGTLGPQYEAIQFNLADRMVIRILSRTYDVKEESVLSKYKKLGDLGETARLLSAGRKSSDISVSEIYPQLKQLAFESGSGSQERKISLMSLILKDLDEISVKYLVRIVLGTMRLGFSEITLVEALSWSNKGDKSFKKRIEDKYRIYPNIGFIAKAFKEKGFSGIENIGIEVGVPILSARCQRVNTAEDIITRHKKSAVEYKYDGTRIQIHLDRSKRLSGAKGTLLFENERVFVKTYTRNLEESTHMFPDIVEGVLNSVRAESAILDCEAIGVDVKTGEFVPFQITIKRKRKHNVKELAESIPLKLVVFDILFYNGQSQIPKPLSERRGLLEKIVKEDSKVMLAPESLVDDSVDLMGIFNEAIKKGLEGIVAKDLNASYTVGSRGYAWIKFKREETGGLEDTLEPVVLGYYKGTGQRSKLGIGAFLVGVLDEKDDSFKTVAKIGTGLTDEQWISLKNRCDKIKIPEKQKNYVVPKGLSCDVWCEPEILVAIRSDEITISPIHSAGYALRFPRLIDFRDDISAKDATTAEELETLHKLWRK